MKYCGNCGSSLEDNAKFCGNCGSIVEEQIPQTKQKPENLSVSRGTSEWSLKSNTKVIIAVSAVVLLIVGLVVGWYFMNDGNGDRNADGENAIAEDIEQTTEEKITVEDIEQTTEEKIAIEDDSDTVINEEIIEYQPVNMDSVNSVTATSALSEYNMTHYPERVVDGDKTTGWVEGVSGQGTNESITIKFDADYEMNGIIINAGFQKNSDLYYKNSRPSEISVSFSDGSSSVYSLQDVIGEQEIRFEKPVVSDRVTFTLLSVYAGNKYQDTVISEIYIY